MHGGVGYIREYPVERHFRDARMLKNIGGPTDVQKRIIGIRVDERRR
jgi:acyl-CoA dehydrogenase